MNGFRRDLVVALLTLGVCDAAWSQNAPTPVTAVPARVAP